MREFEFIVVFEPGADDLMDVFFEYPSLSTRSSTCFATTDRMWRIDHVKGPREALAAFDEVFMDEDRCNECFDVVNCETRRTYHVLDRKRNSRTVYTYRQEVHRCHSIPHHVTQHLGDGVVFESRRTRGEYRWRILYPGERPIGDLYDDIQGNLREGLELEISYLSQAGNWDADSRIAAQLSPAHWEVLEAAVEHGYYARPREVTVAELASLLDAPRSTVQYRLRTAEDLIVQQFVDASL